MITIDPSSFIPFYEQIKQQLKIRILIGSLKSHDPLPSIRDLASSLIINPNTVARAYRELEKEKIIYTRKGKGCFVSADSPKMIKQDNRNLLQELFDEVVLKAQEHDLCG